MSAVVGSTDATGRGTATVTVLFSDLVASTERQSLLGDEAMDTFRHSMFEAFSDAVTSTGGEIVKSAGDGVMVVYRHSAEHHGLSTIASSPVICLHERRDLAG